MKIAPSPSQELVQAKHKGLHYLIPPLILALHLTLYQLVSYSSSQIIDIDDVVIPRRIIFSTNIARELLKEHPRDKRLKRPPSKGALEQMIVWNLGKQRS
jgi:hypothetical protein